MTTAHKKANDIAAGRLRRWQRTLFVSVIVLSCTACSSGTTQQTADISADDVSMRNATDIQAVTEDSASDKETLPAILTLPSYEQRQGDPEIGLQVLAHKGYVGCGIPRKVMDIAKAAGVSFGGKPLPGRDSDLPYYLTEFTTTKGVKVVSPNCLTCHADVVNGEVIIGLGSNSLDFGGLANQVAEYKNLIGLVEDLITEAELTELTKFVRRLEVIVPYVQTLTLGPNAADNLAAILFAHRDPDTLEWHEEPLLEPPPEQVVPVDVPPWWHMRKKNTMFYSAGGRGDHARIMMTASTLCVDSVEEAAEIDSWFPDVRAYLTQIEPPKWPYAIDEELANTGEEVFDTYCAICHGTYGPDEETYPNLLIDLELVGTDTTLAVGAAQFVDRFVDWFNASFYGETAQLEPMMGYVAPPLDGIWISAPYLHNGSVPNLAALLNSSLRPKYWRRNFAGGYDKTVMGWYTSALDNGHAEEPNKAKHRSIYDTTNPGYDNRGHTFGDALTEVQRTALMEYLKTL